jgi:hypothetical protein
MTYVVEHRPAIHRLWFRDAEGDRWIAADDAGFVAGASTPMGYGLAAVARRSGAMSLAAASQQLAERTP